jgi:hypothetical protein
MMSEAETLDGMEKGLKMTRHNTCIFTVFFVLFLVLIPTLSYAESETHVGTSVYKPTSKRWLSSVHNENFESISWIWSLGTTDRNHKNGHRDSILVIPTTSRPDDITLIVWFHGLNGFSKKTFSKRIMPQIRQAVKDGNSLAVAIPEMPWSINTRTPRKRQGQVWRRPEELKKYVESLKKHLRVWSQITHGIPIGTIRLVFVGHSAGGSALKAAAVEGSLCQLNPETIVFSDASYGHWLDTTWKSCVKNTDIDLHILVRKWDKPHKNAERIIKKISRPQSAPKTNVHYQVLDRKQWSHGKIGNSVFILSDIFPPGC